MAENRSATENRPPRLQFFQKFADLFNMLEMILSLLSVVFFCLCCHQLIKHITMRAPLMNTTGFNKAALRVQKAYQILAWGAMTSAFMMALIFSFAQVYAEI